MKFLLREIINGLFLHFSVHNIFEFPLYISSYIIKKIHTIFSFLGRITYYFQIYPRANTNYDTFYVLQRALAPCDFFFKILPIGFWTKKFT